VPMTTASRLCTCDPLLPVVSRYSLADQVDASSQGQGICYARGRHNAGGYCGLARLVVDSKHVGMCKARRFKFGTNVDHDKF